MTGPEHYLTAERLLSAARAGRGRTEEDAATLQAAQVHATLALAAATALADHGDPDTNWTAADWNAWHGVTS